MITTIVLVTISFLWWKQLGIEGEMGEDGQKAQTSIYKVHKFWRYNVDHGGYS